MTTKIRTFIAIELSDEARAALADLQNRLKSQVPSRSVRWTAPEKIHLTLHFLGNVAAEDVEKIGAGLKSVGPTAEPFALTLGQLGCFPNIRRPRVIWAGVAGNTAPLETLHRNLGEQLKEAIDFTPESRPYSPHLTLGRVKKGVPSRHLRQLSQVLETEQPKIGPLATLKVTEISLIKSELTPTGAVYTPLSHGRLGEG